jgi:hypothetical protein
MSVHRAADGIYHMFATRWPEADPRGHNAWPESRVVHATSTAPTGPFTVQQEVGPGHNVMWYRAKDGTYVLYVIGGAYTAKSLDGPWSRFDLKYDLRGMPKVPMSNHSFTSREDGSVLMVSRGGHIWISEDGLKPFRKITSQSLYPRIPGAFEDPGGLAGSSRRAPFGAFPCQQREIHERTRPGQDTRRAGLRPRLGGSRLASLWSFKRGELRQGSQSAGGAPHRRSTGCHLRFYRQRILSD